jgi:hypothetical protein
MKCRIVLAAVVVTTTWLGTATAELTQPDGQEIPGAPGCDSGRPTGLAATFACQCVDAGVCNIGEACTSDWMATHDECDDGVRSECESTMWHEFNDNTCIPTNVDGLIPGDEASVTPETFSPVCPLTFTIVSRGTAMFHDAFGWYNVTGDRPGSDDLHVMLDCDTATGDSAVLDILGHPDYAGGEIGFFLVTPEDGSSRACSGGDCCATVERAAGGEGNVFYSERRFNPDHAGDESFIHLLVFDSHVWPHKFYFAWEDLFNVTSNDFTDLVTSVTGVECAGGGEACDTGRDGVCRHGVTQCVSETLECVGLYDPEDERCDGLDNDCNGEIDDGALCPGEDEVCHNGHCVPNCELSDEFTCPWGFVCDPETGYCIEEDCRDVDCPSDQICRGGHCVGGCDGVVCPHGQSCRLGNCIDPCDGVSCDGVQVCREGICVNGCGQCNGVVCESPLECDDASGECFDPLCETVDCAPGAHCVGGDCIDDCDGVVCPGGQSCVDGQCRYPDESDGDADADTDVDADTDADADTDSDADADDDAEASCACRSGGARPGAELVLMMLFVLGFAIRQRSSRRP